MEFRPPGIGKEIHRKSNRSHIGEEPPVFGDPLSPAFRPPMSKLTGPLATNHHLFTQCCTCTVNLLQSCIVWTHDKIIHTRCSIFCLMNGWKRISSHEGLREGSRAVRAVIIDLRSGSLMGWKGSSITGFSIIIRAQIFGSG